jgi:hypothetical protein
MELDVDSINLLIDTHNNDYDVFRFTIILRLSFILIKSHVHFVYKILRVSGGKMCTTGTLR